MAVTKQPQVLTTTFWIGLELTLICIYCSPGKSRQITIRLVIWLMESHIRESVSNLIWILSGYETLEMTSINGAKEALQQSWPEQNKSDSII